MKKPRITLAEAKTDIKPPFRTDFQQESMSKPRLWSQSRFFTQDFSISDSRVQVVRGGIRRQIDEGFNLHRAKSILYVTQSQDKETACLVMLQKAFQLLEQQASCFRKESNYQGWNTSNYKPVSESRATVLVSPFSLDQAAACHHELQEQKKKLVGSILQKQSLANQLHLLRQEKQRMLSSAYDIQKVAKQLQFAKRSNFELGQTVARKNNQLLTMERRVAAAECQLQRGRRQVRVEYVQVARNRVVRDAITQTATSPPPMLCSIVKPLTLKPSIAAPSQSMLAMLRGLQDKLRQAEQELAAERDRNRRLKQQKDQASSISPISLVDSTPLMRGHSSIQEFKIQEVEQESSSEAMLSQAIERIRELELEVMASEAEIKRLKTDVEQKRRLVQEQGTQTETQQSEEVVMQRLRESNKKLQSNLQQINWSMEHFMHQNNRTAELVEMEDSLDQDCGPVKLIGAPLDLEHCLLQNSSLRRRVRRLERVAGQGGSQRWRTDLYQLSDQFSRSQENSRIRIVEDRRYS